MSRKSIVFFVFSGRKETIRWEQKTRREEPTTRWGEYLLWRAELASHLNWLVESTAKWMWEKEESSPELWETFCSEEAAHAVPMRELRVKPPQEVIHHEIVLQYRNTRAEAHCHRNWIRLRSAEVQNISVYRLITWEGETETMRPYGLWRCSGSVRR